MFLISGDGEVIKIWIALFSKCTQEFSAESQSPEIAGCQMLLIYYHLLSWAGITAFLLNSGNEYNKSSTMFTVQMAKTGVSCHPAVQDRDKRTTARPQVKAEKSSRQNKKWIAGIGCMSGACNTPTRTTALQSPAWLTLIKTLQLQTIKPKQYMLLQGQIITLWGFIIRSSHCHIAPNSLIPSLMQIRLMQPLLVRNQLFLVTLPLSPLHSFLHQC